jgi:hypothetical protein
VEEPKLWKEIGDVAWLVAKVIGGAAIVVVLFFFTLRQHPLIGL